MPKEKCVRCGSTENLVTHHISYIPEITETVCRKCDATLKRKNPKNRGFTIIKLQPPRGLAFLPKDFSNHFNCEFLELETAPVTPVGIIFPYGTPISDIKQGMKFIEELLKLKEK